jgi:putative ABC transport system permease protein
VTNAGKRVTDPLASGVDRLEVVVQRSHKPMAGPPRAREFGVRLALGAVRRDILVLVMRQTFVQLLIGMSGGLALGWVVPRIVRAQSRLVSALEPWHAALAVGVVTLTAFIAVWLPTRRAAKANPVDALRAE